MISPQIIVTKEFFGLFVAQTVVNQNKPVPILNQKTTGAQIDHIIGIGRIGPVPYGFWNHTEHGPTIQLKITSLYRINRHFESKWHAK